MKSRLILLWVFFLLNFGISLAIEPVTTTAGLIAAGSFIWGYVDKTHCRFIECCDKYSVAADSSNITALHNTLQKNVYGQHLMLDIVTRALRGHLSSSNPAKALVLSFHGTTGSGKSYVSQFIAESIFKEGMSSKFVKKYVAGIDFPDHSPSMNAIYKMNIQADIQNRVLQCERSLFIFEDVSKMPSMVLDALRPFIDHHTEIKGVDYRKAIFIFLSNTGHSLINQKTLELWKRGTQREDFKFQDFEHLVRQGAFNEEGGLFRSENIAANLIDHYIPFLPLEERHVRGCINDAFRKLGYESAPFEAVENILEEMTFFPEAEKIYSTSGCKRVAPKVSAQVFGKKFISF